MGRKNYKASEYNPITHKRVVTRWSDERIRQIKREMGKMNEEDNSEQVRQGNRKHANTGNR